MPAGGGPSALRRPLAAPERRRKVDRRSEECRLTPRDSRLAAELPRSSAGVDVSGSAVASSTQAAAKPVATQSARKSWETEQLP